MPTLDPDDPIQLFLWAMENAPESIGMLPFAGLVRRGRVKPTNLSGGVRGEVGELLVRCPAPIVRNLRGPRDEMDIFLLLHLPRAVYDAAKKQAESLIIDPASLIQ